MGSIRTKAQIGGQHSARDCGEARDHNAVNLALGKLIDVRADEQRTLGHAQEDVGGGSDTFADSGAQYLLQYPAQFDDHPLHGAQIVQHGDEEAEEEYHRQYGKCKDAGFNQERAEDELRSVCGIAQKRGHLVAQTLEDLSTHCPAYADDAEQELTRDARDDNAPLDGTALCGEDITAQNEHTRRHQGDQLLGLVACLEVQENGQSDEQNDHECR